jgi:ATP-dependent RNA helicase DDX31/DBP7
MLGRLSLLQRDLRQLATDAFRSFLRSYAAHKGSLKQIFHVKRLHLGHVARSFALRDAPSLLGQSSKKLEMKKEKQERLKRFTRKKKRVTAATMAE